MNRCGFSLVEILVVLLILSLTAGVAGPALIALGGDKEAQDASAQLEVLLRRARRTAVERGVETRLHLDPSSGGYWIRTGTAEDVVGRITLAPGERIESALPRVAHVFSPLGSAEGPPIVVRTPDRVIVIVVDRWTGVVNAETR